MATMTSMSATFAKNITTNISGVKAELNPNSSSICFPLQSEFSSVEGLKARISESLSFTNSGRRATAVYAVEEDVGVFDAPNPVTTKLYVGNLPFNVDSEGLAGLFGEAGEVDQVDVIYDRETGRSRGFAFVTMATPADAESAIEKFDGAQLGGRYLKVNTPAPKSDRPARTERAPRGESSYSGASAGAGNKLYVGNLSWGMDDYQLAELFAEYGQVTEAKVVIDRETGKSRGFGFVTFSSAEEGSTAVEALDGAVIDGRTVRVNVAQDRPRTPRY